MRNGVRAWGLAGASTLLGLLAATGARAQAAPEAPATTVGELIVTARQAGFVADEAVSASKVATPIVDLPRSVSVVTLDEIRNRAPDNLTQVFQYTSGINSDAYGGTSLSRTYTNARGFLSYQYLDGLKLHDSNWAVEPYGLERAELFKGPASSLYGQAGPGGLIALVSKRPSFAPFGEVAFQVGSQDRYQGMFDFGGPLGSSQEGAFRLTGLYRDAGSPIRFQKEDRFYIAPAFTWRPTSRLELTLLGSYQSDPDQTVFQYFPRAGTVDRSAFGYIPRTTFTGEPGFDDLRVNRGQAALLAAYKVSDALTLRENVRYSNYDILARYLQGGGALRADGRSISRTAVNSEFAINLVQTDTQLDWRFRTGPLAHQVLAGVDYVFIPTYQGVGQGAGPVLDLYAPVYGAGAALPALTTKRYQDFDQTGLYLQDQVRWGRLTVLGGVRRDGAWSSTRSLNTATGVTGATVVQQDDAWTGQVGASFRLPLGFAPYAGWATSFQPTPGTDFFGTAFVPSTGEQVEVGVKWAAPGQRVLVTVAGFDLTQQNVRTNDLLHPGFAVQTGEVSASGAEVEAKATLMQGLNLTAAYTYLDIRVTRTNTANQLGRRPAGRPVNQASAWADYALPFAPGLTVGGGVRFIGASFGDPANTFSVPSYTLVDGFARYDLSALQPSLHGVDVSLNVQNAGDERYVTNCDAATQCFYGRGRLIKATIRKVW